MQLHIIIMHIHSATRSGINLNVSCKELRKAKKLIPSKISVKQLYHYNAQKRLMTVRLQAGM